MGRDCAKPRSPNPNIMRHLTLKPRHVLPPSPMSLRSPYSSRCRKWKSSFLSLRSGPLSWLLSDLCPLPSSLLLAPGATTHIDASHTPSTPHPGSHRQAPYGKICDHQRHQAGLSMGDSDLTLWDLCQDLGPQHSDFRGPHPTA